MNRVMLKAAVIAAMKREDTANGPLYRVAAYDDYQIRIIRADNGENVDLAEDAIVTPDSRHIILPPANAGLEALRIAEAVRGDLHHTTGEMTLFFYLEQFIASGYRFCFEATHHLVTHYGVTTDHPLFGVPTENYDEDYKRQREVVAFNAFNLATAADNGRVLPVVVYTERTDDYRPFITAGIDTAFDITRVDPAATDAVAKETILRTWLNAKDV